MTECSFLLLSLTSIVQTGVCDQAKKQQPTWYASRSLLTVVCPSARSAADCTVVLCCKFLKVGFEQMLMKSNQITKCGD